MGGRQANKQATKQNKIKTKQCKANQSKQPNKTKSKQSNAKQTKASKNKAKQCKANRSKQASKTKTNEAISKQANTNKTKQYQSKSPPPKKKQQMSKQASKQASKKTGTRTHTPFVWEGQVCGDGGKPQVPLHTNGCPFCCWVPLFVVALHGTPKAHHHLRGSNHENKHQTPEHGHIFTEERRGYCG